MFRSDLCIGLKVVGERGVKGGRAGEAGGGVSMTQTDNLAPECILN